jgi:hypothetical protein
VKTTEKSTSALDGSEWSASIPGHFTHEENVSKGKEAVWASQPVFTLCRKKKLLPLPESESILFMYFYVFRQQTSRQKKYKF